MPRCYQTIKNAYPVRYSLPFRKTGTGFFAFLRLLNDFSEFPGSITNRFQKQLTQIPCV
jgi:hypothetical protein